MIVLSPRLQQNTFQSPFIITLFSGHHRDMTILWVLLDVVKLLLEQNGDRIILSASFSLSIFFEYMKIISILPILLLNLVDYLGWPRNLFSSIS